MKVNLKLCVLCILSMFYLNAQHSEFFYDLLESHPRIRKIGETGFNAGYSSEVFLSARKDTLVVCFDTLYDIQCKIAKNSIDLNYPDRHNLIEGDSQKTIPRYHLEFPDQTFDLIFIDGGYSKHKVINDIKNMRKFAHQKTILVINDIQLTGPYAAWEDCIKKRIIQDSAIHEFAHRKWVQCQYVFKKKQTDN